MSFSNKATFLRLIGVSINDDSDMSTPTPNEDCEADMFADGELILLACSYEELIPDNRDWRFDRNINLR